MKYLLSILVATLVLGLTPSSVAEVTKEVKREHVVLPAIEKGAKAPKGVNRKLMSGDVDYGYTDQKPIRVGSDEEFGGPKAERAYLDSLLDSKGKKVSYTRLFSGGNDPEGHSLDCYEITTPDGVKVRLWISMYHPKNRPEKQPAPVGFYKKRG